jgi:hypothetical protein
MVITSFIDSSPPVAVSIFGDVVDASGAAVKGSLLVASDAFAFMPISSLGNGSSVGAVLTCDTDLAGAVAFNIVATPTPTTDPMCDAIISKTIILAISVRPDVRRRNKFKPLSYQQI